MELFCSTCGTRLVLPDSAIGAKGRKVKCASCGTVWRQFPNGQTEYPDLPPPPVPAVKAKPKAAPAAKPVVAAPKPAPVKPAVIAPPLAPEPEWETDTTDEAEAGAAEEADFAAVGDAFSRYASDFSSGPDDGGDGEDFDGDALPRPAFGAHSDNGSEEFDSEESTSSYEEEPEEQEEEDFPFPKAMSTSFGQTHVDPSYAPPLAQESVMSGDEADAHDDDHLDDLHTKVHDLFSDTVLPTAPKKRDYRLVAALAAGLAVLALLGGSFYGFRNTIVERYPDMLAVYDAMNIPIDVLGAGLKFDSDSTVGETVQTSYGTTNLVVRGMYTNTSSRTRSVPAIRLVVVDDNGLILQDSLVAPLHDTLASHSKQGFRVAIESLAPSATRWKWFWSRMPSDPNAALAARKAAESMSNQASGPASTDKTAPAQPAGDTPAPATAPAPAAPVTPPAALSPTPAPAPAPAPTSAPAAMPTAATPPAPVAPAAAPDAMAAPAAPPTSAHPPVATPVAAPAAAPAPAQTAPTDAAAPVISPTRPAASTPDQAATSAKPDIAPNPPAVKP